ncbi:right-handed parallel beta-helix repeat-containing protein [Niallia taxi]|uniref:right-handed parallel beta-helix repeat-containing protein n=1 Tax=Niallia taxi TaxID=2499688 RepID=UPI003D2CA497
MRIKDNKLLKILQFASIFIILFLSVNYIISLTNSSDNSATIDVVKDFDADPTGKTNSSKEIQEAINSAKRNTTVVLNGKFLINSTININNPNIIVTGSGEIIKKKGKDIILVNVNADNVTIKGLSFNGNASESDDKSWKNDIIQLNNVSNSLIESNNIAHSSGGGINGYNAANNIVRNNTISNIQDNGIFFGNNDIVEGENSDNNIIKNNTIDGTYKQNCIFITASSSSQKTDEYIYNNIIQGNKVKNCGDAGIETGIHGVGTIISENEIVDSLNSAILVRDNKYPRIINNKINMNNMPSTVSYPYSEDMSIQHGITFLAHIENAKTWITNGEVLNNSLVGTKQYAIRLVSGQFINVNGNKIENCIGIGVYVSSKGQRVENNNIGNCNIGISLAEEESNEYIIDSVTINNNNIKDIDKGIVISNKKLVNTYVQNNLIEKASRYGIEGTNSSLGDNNSIIQNNQVNNTINPYYQVQGIINDSVEID